MFQIVEGVIMSDLDGEPPRRAQFWLDIEWVDPKSKADDDRSPVQAFIEKLSRAIKAVRQRKKN
jgi:hypothetical protein